MLRSASISSVRASVMRMLPSSGRFRRYEGGCQSSFACSREICVIASVGSFGCDGPAGPRFCDGAYWLGAAIRLCAATDAVSCGIRKIASVP